MNTKKAFFLIFFCAFSTIFLIFFTKKIYAQEQQAGNPGGEKVTLERADVLKKVAGQPNVRKLVGNVVIRHNGTMFYCDSAYFYENKNAVDAFGKTRVVSEKGSVITADTMYYDGNTQLARARGLVNLQDEKMNLQTPALDYQIASGIASYYQSGKIEDSEKTLTSKAGTYDSNSKIFYFSKDVVLISKKDQQKIETETLNYNTIDKMAYFKGNTKITSKDGIVNTTEGNFNTENQISNFKGRTFLRNGDYTLEGDSVYFERKTEFGYAWGNVILNSLKDSLQVEGDFAWVRQQQGESRVYGNAIARQISGVDTLWLKADTLFAVNEKTKTNPKKYLIAYQNTKIFRKDLQAVCDSLAYNRADSTLQLYGSPIMWANKSQLSADTIFLELDNNAPKKGYLKHEAYLIAEDTLHNFNQIKGKNMTAFFKEKQIKRLEVKGNAQNILFALKEKTNELIGLNRVDCSDMNILFKGNNKAQRVSYINKVDATFTPPHEIVEPQKKFKNFRWDINRKPTKNQMLVRKEQIVKSKDKDKE